MRKFRAKKSLVSRIGAAFGRKSRKSEAMRSGLATVGGAAGLAVVSAVISAVRDRKRGDRDAR